MRRAPGARPEVVLIVSVDTEEDDWARARRDITVDNIRQLPRLDRLFEQLGVRATYFTSYQVAIDREAAAVMRTLHDSGRAEIAAHLHPWNTPPLVEAFEPRNSMLSNLPYTLQLAKLHTLTDALSSAIGERPRAFRAGRWGLGPDTVRALTECGYHIDSSVTPFKSWKELDGPSFIGAPLTPYRLDGRRDPRIPVPEGAVLEIPVSWAYSRRPWRVWSRFHRFIAQPRLQPFRLVWAASRLNVVKHIALSPESNSPADMLTLSRRLLEDGVRHLHLFFHSPSLAPGLGPFVTTTAAVDKMYAAISTYVEALDRETSLSFATISEAGQVLDSASGEHRHLSPVHGLQ